jgi:hypothetical protein
VKDPGFLGLPAPGETHFRADRPVPRLLLRAVSQDTQDLEENAMPTHAAQRSFAVLNLVAGWLCASGVAHAQTPLTTHAGTTKGEDYGYSVSRAGDVNADGVPDYAVGSKSSTTASFGHVWVYSGATHELLFEVLGTTLTPALGVSIAPAGDLNLDGHDDLIVGASTGSLVWLGATLVLSGADGSELFHFQASEPGDRYGWAVSSADVNADGWGDVIVGAPDHGTDSGLVAIYSGADGSLIRTHRGTADHTQLGSAVAGVGDIDGDGFEDVAAGAPGISYGSVRLYSGLDGSLIDVLLGTENLHLGALVASVGDVNLDGVPDFSATGNANLVLVYSGADRTVIHVLQGSAQSVTAVDNAGDMDADGVPDIVVGSVSTFLCAVKVVSGADGSQLRTFKGESFGDWFGRSVAGIGDVDGDSVPDLLIGTRAHSVTIYKVGTARVYSGQDVAPWTTYCSAQANSSGDAATVGYLGSPSLADEQVSLALAGAVTNSTGLFIYSPQQQLVPFGNGVLCVGGGGANVHRLQPFVTNMSGHGGVELDFSMPPLNGGPGALTPGSTWNFQAWFRDLPAGGAQFNLSNALAATFVP